MTSKCSDRTENPDRGSSADPRQIVGTWVVGGLICYIAVLAASKQFWFADFWNYATFVLCIQQDGFGPTHSLFEGQAAYVPYWPYLAINAALSTLTGLAPHRILSWMGLFNCIAIVVSLRLLLRRLQPRIDFSFYALISILILWGSAPWNYSNFFHLNVLPLVVAYPASFAFATGLLAGYYLSRFLSEQNHYLIVPLTVLTSLAVLVHPITGLFTLALEAAVFASHILQHGFRLKFLWGFAFLAMICALCALWPPFPMVSMIGSSAYMEGPRMLMYVDVLSRLYPVLILTTIFALHSKPRQLICNPFFLTALFLGLVYWQGYITNRGSFGRVVSYVAISLQLFCAQNLAQLEQWLRRKSYPIFATSLFVSLSIISGLIILPRIALLGTLPNNSLNDCLYAMEAAALLKGTDRLITTPETSHCFMPFGIQVAAPGDEFSLPPELVAERQVEARNFFYPETSNQDRILLLKKRRLNVVFFQTSQAESDSQLLEKLATLGAVVRRTERYILIGVPGNS